MKTNNLLLSSILLFNILLNSCIFPGLDDDIIVEQSSMYSPIIMERAEFENSTQLLTQRDILNSGKIYLYSNFIFINEVNEGFHIVENSNPSSPVNIKFLKVLGSTDMAIKNDVLYVNNSNDLIAIKPNFEENTIEITKRIENIYSDSMSISPDGFSFSTNQDEVIVGWELIN